jgi:hypothetical protein
MTILGKYWLEKPKEIAILPSLPPVYKAGTVEHSQVSASENYSIFNGIFDPLTYGMYLLGEDPKNNFGKIIFGSKPSNHLISNLDFELKQKEDLLLLVLGEKEFPIFCLHVHSKNERIFQSSLRKKEIARSILLATNSKVKFSISTFSHLAINALRRRLRGLKNA